MCRRDPATWVRAIAVALSAWTLHGCSTVRVPVVPARELPPAPPSETVPAPVEPSPAPLEPEILEVVHVVQAGETLWRIARAHGVDPADVARANGLSSPDRIEVGQRLVIPGAVPAARGFAWPVAGRRVLSPFGSPRGGRRHAGIDLAGSSGDAVVAVFHGTVVYSGSSLGGYGKTVIVDHGDGVRSLYAHNADLLVQEGQAVVRGEAIARVGRSGNATTEHLHFEIRKDGVAVDPLGWLTGSATP
jgi:murein DD-endopeptidase MepM/ murein hydrolase activator NlpD